MPGFFIEIEGIDKSGKETQSDLLAKRLALDGFRVVRLSFPDYSTPIGKIIEQNLKGYGLFTPQESPFAHQALMTVNRYENQERIDRALMDDKIIVSDRYLTAGMVYGLIEGINLNWFHSISYSLTKPDLTIVLDISEEEYLRRLAKYDEVDLNEVDLDKIRKVKGLYLKLAIENGWVVVNGEGDREEISQIIYDIVKERMKQVVDQ